MKTCEYTVDVGAQVTLTASAAAGATFVDWTGACTGITGDCTFTAADQPEVTATIGTPGEHRWSEGFAGGGAEGANVVVDVDGSVVVAFRNIGSIDIRGTQHVGNSDLLVAKFRRDQSLAWAKQFAGGSSYMEPGDLEIAPNGDILLVAFGDGASLDGQTLPAGNGSFLARLDGATGAKKLLHALSTTTDFLASSVGSHGDEIIVAGSLTGTVDFGAGGITSTGTDTVIAWFSATGALIRTRRVTGSGNEYGNIAVDTNGNVFVGGSYSGTFDAVPGAAGGELTTATGASDAFLAQFSADGTFQWAQRYSGAGSEYFTVRIGPSGRPVVAGTASMDINLNPGGTGGSATGSFIAMFTPDGALRWKYTAGTGAIAVDGRDSVYFTTFCDSQTNLGSGVVPGTGRFCAARLGDTGNLVWAKRFAVSDNGAAGAVRPAGLSSAPSGIHAFAGVAYESVSFGGPTIPANSSGFLYVGGP